MHRPNVARIPFPLTPKRPSMDQVFLKYENAGAYHWTIAIDRGRLRSCPQLNARYDLPISIVADRFPLSEVRGLDVGCGDGVLVYKVRTLDGTIEGLDYSEEGLRLARQKLAEHGVSAEGLRQGSVYELPYEDASFDYVTAVELIEHLDDPECMLAEAKRVLKPGGVFVCTTPNGDRHLRAGEVRDPYHVQEFPPAELLALVARYFGNGEVRGFGHAAMGGAYRHRAGSVALKLLGATGANLFRLRGPTDPGRRWNSLLAVARKKAPLMGGGRSPSITVWSTSEQ